MSDNERARYERLLAEAHERNAALTRMLERQGYQLDRMQDQLEKALREIAVLRRQLNKPPPDEPPPAPPGSPSPGGDDTAAPPSPPPKPEKPEKPPRKKRERFGRNKIPAGLERVPDPEATGTCPKCGNPRVTVLREERTEVYDYIPAKLVARVVDRPVCHCADCAGIVQAPLPADLVPRLLATPNLLAHLIYEKFGRALPLHRIDIELRRLGGDIREVTRDRWLRWSARQLDLLLPALKTRLFVEGLLHTDGTGLAVIQKGTGTRLGQVAIYCNARAAIYEFTTTKHGVHQRVFLGLEGPGRKPPAEGTPRFAGYQVADAASVADQTYTCGGIVECGCNAHARRMFEEAEASEPRVAGEAIAFWSVLYAVERQGKGLGPAARLALRREKSAPVVADFRRWLDAQHGRFLPQEPITKALNYVNNHWVALIRFLDDGRIPIDNNLAERMLKAVAVGRKNYMFAGSDAAAARAATFYTWVETCRLHGVDPPTWLADVLPRIATTRPSEYNDLLPHRWAELRRQSSAA
jgi:transposase